MQKQGLFIGVCSQLINSICDGMSSIQMLGIETIWELHTPTLVHLQQPKNVNKTEQLQIQGGIMVVTETPFANSNAIFYSLLAVGHMRQPREQKFTGSILQEHF